MFCTCGNSNPKIALENGGKRSDDPGSVTVVVGGITVSFDIAFEDEYGLCVANLKTGKKTLVDEQGTEGNISRDGKQIVYVRNNTIYLKDFVYRSF